MRRIRASSKKAIRAGIAVALAGMIMPWHFLIPNILPQFSRSDLLLNIPLFEGLLTACLLTWLWSKDSLQLNDERVTFTRREREVWGGRWDEMAMRRGPFRYLVVDAAGRTVSLDFLKDHFEPDNQLILLLSEVSVEDSPIPPMPRWPGVMSLASGAAMVLSAWMLANSMAGDAFSWDLRGRGLIALVILSSIFLAVSLCFLTIASGARARYERGSPPISVRRPREMIEGVRYVYENAMDCRRQKMPYWGYHAIIFLLECPAIAILVLGGPRGSEFLAILILALCLPLHFVMHPVGRREGGWRDSALDAIEVTHGGDILVFRGNDVRRYSRVDKPAQPWARAGSWSRWWIEYEDRGEIYRVDTRFLIPEEVNGRCSSAT